VKNIPLALPRQARDRLFKGGMVIASIHHPYIHKQNLFSYKLVAKLLGGRNSCLERKLREEKATKPHTKGRGTQLTE
tara:strand:+ start:318 stop:548 length:231 start_codon:yes stop_codon:yes gene_type:complete